MLEGYRTESFTHEGKTKDVFIRGTGPAVIVMTEIPGITGQVKRFGDWVAEAGMTAYLPNLFGTPGREISTGYVLRSMAKACISHEFHVLASNRSSPVTVWLRALAKQAHETCGGPGVGAVGMCLTGNFALSLMMEPSVIAPVLSQPSLPFPLSRKKKQALHCSEKELANVKARCAAGDTVIGLRFKSDSLVPDERFDRLKTELGAGFEAIELEDEDALQGTPVKAPHSCLTTHVIDETGQPTRAAVDRVLGFFREKLAVAPASA